MSEENPLIARYMARFEEALQQHRLREWREIAADLRSHIAEAQGYGKSLDEVIAALGPADVLARAYAVELTMNAPRPSNIVLRVLKVAGILAASSFLSFIVGGVLGTIAVGFTGSGILIVVLCVLEGVGVHIPGAHYAGLSPWLIMLIGPPLAALGIGAGWLLWRYVFFLTATLRRAIPRAFSPARAA